MLGLRPNYPPIAVEIGEGYATALRLQKRGPVAKLVEWERVDLPVRQAPDESLGGAFTLDEQFRIALEDLLERFGKIRRLSLVIPDIAVRSFFIELENPAGTRKELRDMILFKIKKLTPVNLEGVTLAYQRLRSRNSGGEHYLAVLASKRLTGGYGRFFEGRGIHLGLVENASIASVNLFEPILEEAAGEGDLATLRIGSSHFTVGLFRNGALAFSRTRLFSPEDREHSIEHEVRTLGLYAQDKLESPGISNVFILCTGADEVVSDSLSRAGFNTRTLMLEDVVSLPSSVLDQPELQGMLTAAAGAAARR